MPHIAIVSCQELVYQARTSLALQKTFLEGGRGSSLID